MTATARTQIQQSSTKQVLRILWVLIVLSIIGIYIAGIPNYFTILRDSPRWAQGYAPVMSEFGITAFQFAFYFVFIESFSLLILTAYATIIFLMRYDDWVALMVSLMLIFIGAGTTLNIHYNSHLIGSLILGTGFTLVFATLALFPDGHFQPARAKYGLVFWSIVGYITAPHASALLAGESLSATRTAQIILLVIAPVMGLIAQNFRYRNVSTAEQQQQTKWVLLGFLVWIASSLLVMLVQFAFPALRIPAFFPDSANYTLSGFIAIVIFVPITFFSTNLLPFSFALSAMKYRLWNIDIVINRSLVYVIQTLGLVTVFTFVFFFLQLILQFVLGSEQDALAAAISAGAVVAVFNPVRKRARRFIDRYLFGLRFDLDQLNQAHRQVTITNPGQFSGQLLGNYDVLDVLGRGGMGEVYLAMQGERKVAIKLLLAQFASNSEMLARFQREAETGMKLVEHDNIAGVYELGEVNGVHFMVMDYVEGCDLRDLLEEKKKLDLQTVQRILKDVCSALAMAHENGFVHRDIKPANIMLRESGEAILMDFGITKLQDAETSLTGTGAIGTIDYMAPEQIIAAKDVDLRADIYALGITTYQMLTGEKPFQGGAGQVMFAQIQQPAPDPRDLNADIPEHIADAILKALEKDPDDRFDSVEDFATTLQ